MGDVRRARELYRHAEASPALARDRLLEASSSPDPLLRHVAGVLLARHHPNALPEHAVRELLDTLLNEWAVPAEFPPVLEDYARRLRSGPPSDSELKEMLPGLEAAMEEYHRQHPPSRLASEYVEATASEDDCGDLGQDIARALARLPAGSADFAVAPLLALWQRDRSFYESALAATCLSFPEARQRPPTAALNEIQRAVLEALLGDWAIWVFCGDTAPLLAARGLPDTPAGMRAYLRG